MALATNGSVGTIHLDGDLIDTRDAYNPQLTPTGVQPGVYYMVDLVVDSKGRVVEITGSVSPATHSVKGLVQFGTNITDEGSGVFGVSTADNTTLGLAKSADTNNITITAGAIDVGPDVVVVTDLASPSAPGIAEFGTNITDEGSGVFGVSTADNTTLGVVKSADTDHITITAGAIDVGPKVVTSLATRTIFTAGQAVLPYAIPRISSNYTPDNSAAMISTISALSGDGTLLKPTSAVVGDIFHIIVDSNGYDLTLASEYKVHSTPVTPVGTSVITCLMIATDVFYTVIQHEFV